MVGETFNFTSLLEEYVDSFDYPYHERYWKEENI